MEANKKVEKELSVGKTILLVKTVPGIVWIVCAVLNIIVLFSHNEFMDLIPALTLCIAMAITLYVVAKAKKEELDEMARKELVYANSQTLMIMNVIIAAVLIIVLFLSIANRSFANETITVKNAFRIFAIVIYLYMGIQNVLTGYYFQKAESGDIEWQD